MVFRAGAVPRIDAEGHLPDDVVEVLAEDLEGLVGGATDPAELAALVTGPTNDLKTALNATYVSSEDVRAIVRLTQAEYDALTPKDAATLYVVVEA